MIVAPTDQTPLGDVREWLNDATSTGDMHPCPACYQNVKRYPRTITSTMAMELIKFHRIVGTAYDHLPTVLKTRGGDTAKLRYWGLLEAMPDQRRADGSNRGGFWRVTEAGVAFVYGRTRVPKRALVYNKQLLALYGDHISIRDALGKKFNYDELMGERWDDDGQGHLI